MATLKPSGEVENTTNMFPILLPREQFAFLNEFHRDRFNNLFLGGKYGPYILPEFWRGVTARRDPRVKFHPLAPARTGDPSVCR